MGRRKDVERSLKIVWSSLRSHLPLLKGRNRRWHKQVIKEYAEVIRTLVEYL